MLGKEEFRLKDMLHDALWQTALFGSLEDLTMVTPNARHPV
jgi:hypothetical protein